MTTGQRGRALATLVLLAFSVFVVQGSFVQGPAEKIDPADAADSTAAYLKIPHTRTLAARDTTAGQFFGLGGYEFMGAALALSTIPDTTFGTANDIGGFRLMIISGAPANDDTLRVIGMHVFEAFNTAAALDTAFIFMAAADSAGMYYQTEEKWSGQVALSLTDASAVGARSVNVGKVSFFDNLGADFTVTDVYVDGLFGATQADLKMWLREHQKFGWGYDGVGTFSAANYPPPIIKLSDVQPDDDSGIALTRWYWRQTGINRVIEASAGHGFVLHVQTTTDHAMGPMNATIWTTTP